MYLFPPSSQFGFLPHPSLFPVPNTDYFLKASLMQHGHSTANHDPVSLERLAVNQLDVHLIDRGEFFYYAFAN